MGNIPAFLLTQTAVVEPYQGGAGGGAWTAYGPAEAYPCQVDERMSGRLTEAGRQVVTITTVYFQLDVPCPVGSRVTLPDGRLGYAAAVARHDSGGLPTPDHIEVQVDTATVAAAPHAETVTLLRRTVTGVDARYGNTTYGTTAIEVPGTAVAFVDSDETLTDRRDQIKTRIELVMPPDTDVKATDRVRVRGLVYAINGEPEVLTDAHTGAEPGVRVQAQRVAG